MQTVVIDGKEYVLIPKEDLQPTVAGGEGSQPPANNGVETTQDALKSVLDDFLDEDATPTPNRPVDDGLATQDEKENAIRVVIPSAVASVPKAAPKPYTYREKFLKKELSASDVVTPPKYNKKLLEGNPEDPMIKADNQKPEGMKLFYGPGIQYEGY